MSDRTHELLHRNLQEVFGEGDAARRRAAIAELYTDNCMLYVPSGKFVGHEALDKFAGDLRATTPTSSTPHKASRRRSIMPGVSLGDQGRAANRPTTRAWMWS